jgi:prepilin-type N-terminal cleavage/methylation domain-containing protein
MKRISPLRRSQEEPVVEASRDGNRSERGDTLIEVLLAIVIIGIASVAILVAFATSLSGSSEHRNLTTMDTVLRTAAEETISQIQQQTAAQWGSCPSSPYSTLSVSLPTGWTMQMSPTVSGSAYPVKYWNSATSSFGTSTQEGYPAPSACTVSTIAAPQVNSPQLITITVTNTTTGVVSAPLSFVVDDPLSRPIPASGPATHLVFVSAPSGSMKAGVAFGTQPVVEVEDANNNIVTTDFSAVSLSVNSGTGATLSNSCLGTEFNGVVTFTGCSIGTVGSNYTLTASDSETNTVTGGVLTPATSSPSFSITVGTASQLSFNPTAPGPGTAGIAIPSLSVQVLDSSGNLVTSAGGSVTMSIAAGGPQSSFTSGTTTVALSGGVATFSNLVVRTSGSYTLTATPVGITGVTGTFNSSVFVVSPGSPSSFSVSNPGSQTAGVAFNDTLTAFDAYGNAATGYSGTASVSISGPSNGPNGTAPSYPTSVAVTSGVGTLSGITLYDAQSTSLTVSVSGTNPSSGSFTVVAGPYSVFTLANPGTQKAGTAFSDVITATDAYGNVAPAFTGIQSLTFSGPSNGPTSGTPTYPATVNFAAGVGTASGITLVNAQNTTLTAGLVGVNGMTGTSGSFTVTSGSAAKLAFSPATPGPGTAGGVIPNVAVQALDGYGNLATATSGSVTMSLPAGDPVTTFTTSTTSVSLSSGVATFSNLIVNTNGTYTLKATPVSIANVTTAVTSNSFTVAKFSPNLLETDGTSGGTTGKIQTGDHIGVTFPVPLSAASVCPGKTAGFTISGTVTIASNAAPSTGNDELYFTPAAGACTGNVAGFASGTSGSHAGYIDLGSKTLVATTATFASSSLTFNPTANDIQVVLGGTISGGGTLVAVPTAVSTYFPDSAILSNAGLLAASGSVADSATFSPLQPTAVSIASGTSSPNGTPSSGDQATYTYSEQMDPNSILSGWSGASTAVTACFARGTTGSTVLSIDVTGGCTTGTTLGTVNLGDASPYYVNASSAVALTATMAMTTVSGDSVVTVTFTSSGAFNSVTANTRWTWTPNIGAADLAGDPVSATAPTASPSQENFGGEQVQVPLSVESVRRHLGNRMSQYLTRIVL